jgi:hypothetical protein
MVGGRLETVVGILSKLFVYPFELSFRGGSRGRVDLKANNRNGRLLLFVIIIAAVC